MKQPPSSNQRQRSSFNTLVSPHRFTWLRQLGLLVLGAGLGAMGMKWLSPDSHSSTNLSSRALEVEAAPDRSISSNSDSSNSETTEGTVAEATVCVKTFGPQGGPACASGVSIDPQLVGLDPQQGSVVLTNFHVVAEPIDGLPVQLGGKGEVFDSELIQQSPEFDLALLFVPNAKFPVATIADASPEAGIAVRAIGFPNNQPLTIKKSTLLGETQNCLAVSPCLAIQQGTITHGNSGGPLEANGTVIGITEGETTEEIAIPIEQVHQFLTGQLPASAELPPQLDNPRFRTRDPYPFPPSMEHPHPHPHPDFLSPDASPHHQWL